MEFVYSSADVHNNQGVDKCLKRDYENGLDSFNQAIRIRKDFHEAWHNRGVALFYLEQNEDALVSFDKANENSLVSFVSFDKAIEDALASFDKAIELEPKFYQAWYSRGVLLLTQMKYKNLFPGSLDLSEESKKQYQEAIASFNKTIEIKREYHQAWYDRAECYAIIQKGDLAIKDLEEAIQLNPEYKTQAKTNTYFDEIREDERFKKLIED